MQEEGSVVQRWEEAGDSGRSVFRQCFSFSAAENTEVEVVRLAGLGSSLEFC